MSSIFTTAEKTVLHIVNFLFWMGFMFTVVDDIWGQVLSPKHIGSYDPSDAVGLWFGGIFYSYIFIFIEEVKKCIAKSTSQQ